MHSMFSQDPVYFAICGHCSTVSGVAKADILPRYTSAALPCQASCQCNQQQTVKHVVVLCALIKLLGGLFFHHVEHDDGDAIQWLENTGTTALTE